MWFKELFKKDDTEKSLYEEALEKCKNNEEYWVDIKGIKGYKVSNFGRVIDKNTGEEIIQRAVGERRDTLTVQIFVNKVRKTFSVAKLEANSFEIPNPTNSKMVYHIGDRLNNNIDNLTYDRTAQPRNIITKSMIDQVIFNDDEIEYSDKDRIDKELAKPISESKEIWKDVVGYERWYEVSDKGNVRRIERDGSTKLLKARPDLSRGRRVGLRMTDKPTYFQVSHLVACAFNLKKENGQKNIYHIDGDVNNDCLSNLTYDKTETEAFIKEQERLKEEQEKRNERKEQFVDYIEANKEFLQQAKEMNKEITIKDIYNKLDEILEVLKNVDR